MEIKDSVNPVGTVVQDENISMFVEAMVSLWKENNGEAAWWQFWKRVNFLKVANFLINCLDDLISYFVQHNIPGADKKATVIDTLGAIYDAITKGLLPIYLIPFSSGIKNFVLNVVVSSAIDWIVEKYKNGSWRPKPVEEVVAQWVTMHAQFVKPIDHRPSL